MTRILIVDDEPRFRRALRLSLEVEGYDIRDAANGRDALNLMGTDRVDLILLDWQMPEMDGPHVCQAIRARSAVPIIMLTCRLNGRSEALAAGASDYITKPFALDDLLTHIQTALAK